MDRMKRKNSGFTLMELLVVSGLFLILIGLATGTFVQTMKTQRTITKLSESMNNVAFVMEQMSREIRVGFSFSGGGDTLSFINSSDEFVTYKKNNDGIERCINNNCAVITSPDVTISNLGFRLQGEVPGDNIASRVTILLSVSDGRNIEVNLQTTVSSRVLEG
jgi:prepilin-type N-terminal cleavage/methylation domain-containing protein